MTHVPPEHELDDFGQCIWCSYKRLTKIEVLTIKRDRLKAELDKLEIELARLTGERQGQ